MMYQDVLLWAIFIVVIILIVWVVRIEIRLKLFFRGKKAAQLEHTIGDIIKEMELLHASNGKIEKEQIALHGRLNRAIRNIATVRFNPFQDSGGNQSFATCLVNEDGDGVIISSLYAHGKSNIFAKPIRNYECSYDLTEEEEYVLRQTQQGNNE